jgi:hypothetical protein
VLWQRSGHGSYTTHRDLVGVAHRLNEFMCPFLLGIWVELLQVTHGVRWPESLETGGGTIRNCPTCMAGFAPDAV